MSVEFLKKVRSGSRSSVRNRIIVSEDNIDSEFTEVSLQELPVVKFCVNFENIVEGVHFNLAREVTGEDLCDYVAIREVSEINESGLTREGSQLCKSDQASGSRHRSL